MNCEDFEQSVLTAPKRDDDARQRHADACPKCARLLERVRRLEQRLDVLMAVPIPAAMRGALPDMAARDRASADPDTAVTPAPRSSLAPPLWLALAASIALVAVLVLRQPDTTAADGGVQLAAAIIEHIGPELGAMRPAGDAVPTRKLTDVLAPAGATLSDRRPLVSYAKSCVINGRLVPHLVLQGEQGPVTVLLMPEEAVAGPVSIMRDGLEGVILPVGERGSIAIIGHDAASVEAVRQQALDAVDYRI